nr:hypothetical protein BaRGS_032847 [Batillaria attramentaria]
MVHRVSPVPVLVHRIKKEQQHIVDILESKHIPFEQIDITSNESLKEKMRGLAGATSLPPQLAKGDTYLGDFEAFDNAVEEERLEELLKL